jgi:hypothetical protein
MHSLVKSGLEIFQAGRKFIFLNENSWSGFSPPAKFELSLSKALHHWRVVSLYIQISRSPGSVELLYFFSFFFQPKQKCGMKELRKRMNYIDFGSCA